MTGADYDLCVIGGGINGAGIARDAAGRGLKVLLTEARDLAAATSSSSTKLVHGGLRYLEYGALGLVRHSLAEREILLRAAPHIVSPMEFVLPHDENLRPVWMIRTGLFLYDHLAGRKKLKASQKLDLASHPYRAPLSEKYMTGFSYSDCWVDDARLVVLNALDAAERGASVLTRVSCENMISEGDAWRIELRDTANGLTRSVKARMAVNAAGPWVRQVLDNADLAHEHTPQVRLVKGSHIVVRRLFDGPQSYMIQQPDRRIVFVIPYEDEFTLIGTTESKFSGNPASAAISEDESEYLLAAVNRSFKKQINADDIIWTYSGVRPLLDDGSEQARAVTRDYRLILDESFGPRLLSVFGGKITTYRHLAAEAIDALTGRRSKWTEKAYLPGGDIPDGNFEAFAHEQRRRYSFLPGAVIQRYARAYGTRMDRFLQGVSSIRAMGEHYGDNVYEAEIGYMTDTEWAKTPEDALWRRSKLGLHVTALTAEKIRKSSFFKGMA